MNSKKQIYIIGITFILIISLLFLNIIKEYSDEHKMTTKELAGIQEITALHNLDVSLKRMWGISQLQKRDTSSLNNNLFLNNNQIYEEILKLKNKKIHLLYQNIQKHSDKTSKVALYKEYTELLKLISQKRIDIADDFSLLLESDRELYFLITTAIIEIPKIIENIGKIRALGIRILADNNDEEATSLLEKNIDFFTERISNIQYTISKIHPQNSTQLTSLLNLILTDFYNIAMITSDLKYNRSLLTPKEYFLATTEVVSKINNLFLKSKDIVTSKLITRVDEIETLLAIYSLIYSFAILFILLSIYYVNRTLNTKHIHSKIKKNQDEFIKQVQNDYLQDKNLKDICNNSILLLVNHFQALNASLYLYSEENKKLYLGALYNLKSSNLNQTLNLHENIISETMLEKKLKIIDINQIVDLGNLKIEASKLITIPIMEFQRTIGVIQLTFDNKFNDVDINFLQSVVSLMGTYINKSQKDEQTLHYLQLIDQQVLISKTDIAGNIIAVSEQLCLLSQYTKEELIGKTHRVLRHPDMPKDFFVDLWSTIKRGESWQGEIKNRKKDGSYYWIDSHISPDFDINGNIIGYTALRTDITDKKQIQEIAITDGLTALYNRRHFDTIFAQQIDINKREKGLLVFALIDIDFFKQFNDTYGHQEGDKTLKLVAQTLQNSLKRADDYTFRLGGEEFGLLYHVNKVEDAIVVANQSRENVKALHIEHTKNTVSKFVTISIGFYIINSDNTLTVDEIYKRTDDALYSSKQNGRDRVTQSEI